MKIVSGLSEGQVLQRLCSGGAQVKIKGESREAAGPILATISERGEPLESWKQRRVGTVTGGVFAAELSTIPPGGPYRLELQCGGKKERIANFFVGDVWLLAGQSNMQGEGNLSGAAKPHPLIRVFSMRREWRAAIEPLHVLNESPDRCHNEGIQQPPEEGERYRANAAKGSGVGLHFAREMLERSGVPQALICSAHGATSMEQWDPALKGHGGDSMYGSMLLSVRATGQPIAGVLWYQGESDRSPSQASEYTGRMKQLVAAVRRDLRLPDLPWVTVQIGRIIGPGADSASWNSIQEQQRLLPEKIKNLETVAAIDLALDDNIHISSKSFPRLAARMARAADYLVYRNKNEAPPPRLRAVIAGGSTNASGVEPGLGVDVVYDHVGNALQAGSEPRGFTLLDAQGCVWPNLFKTTLHGNTIRLFLSAPLADGVRLSYGHGVDPDCNITDSRGYALPVFGPVECRQPGGSLPFLKAWKHTRVVQSSLPLKEIACPDFKAFDTCVKSFGDNGFVDNHADWINHSGHAYFWSRIELSEPMKLVFLMGYDGPFRLWLDGKPFFDAVHGANPCLPDEGSKIAALKAGIHQITIGMDTNGGRTWGFFLRFRRLDISSESLRKGTYGKPFYCP
jgi:sialate O-acetylesterase